MNLDSLILLVVIAVSAGWFWYSQGIQEQALVAARRYCLRENVELLDENVALQRTGLLPDLRGRKRFGRLYTFEFTVTGQQRHLGKIVMFGHHVGSIELAPYKREALTGTDALGVQAVVGAVPLPVNPRKGEVIRLEDWRKAHPNHQSAPRNKS